MSVDPPSAPKQRADMEQKRHSPNDKMSITINSAHGPRTVTWEMAKADPTREDKEQDFRVAIPLIINDLASALRHAHTLSHGGRPHIHTINHRNTYYLPHEPSDTQICSGFNVPQDLPAYIPERIGYYCIVLEFSCSSEVAAILQAKTKALDAGGILEYTKDELAQVTALQFSKGGICRPEGSELYWDNLSCMPFNHRHEAWDTDALKYRIRLHFPGTQEAIDAMKTRLQAVINGKPLEFTADEMAHVSYVEHYCRRQREMTTRWEKAYYSDFDMQRPSEEEHDSYLTLTSAVGVELKRALKVKKALEVENAGKEYPVDFLLKFGRLQQQHSQELADQYLWLEQERVAHNVSRAHRASKSPFVPNRPHFLQHVPSVQDATSEIAGNATFGSDKTAQQSDAREVQTTEALPGNDDDVRSLGKGDTLTIDDLEAKASKLREALLTVEQQIAKLRLDVPSAERSEGLGGL
jgi:hypothetical protein